MSRSVREQVVIAAPAERVWETVMDPARLGEWVTTHQWARPAGSGPVSEGDRFTQRLRVAGKSFEVEWLVVAADAPRAARWVGDGPAGSQAEVSYVLAAAEEATRFVYENSFELPGGVLGRLAGAALVADRARREARRSLENLRRLLESPPRVSKGGHDESNALHWTARRTADSGDSIDALVDPPCRVNHRMGG
jgi:Polyketide cyclase / dehydrase and lipid transport